MSNSSKFWIVWGFGNEIIPIKQCDSKETAISEAKKLIIGEANSEIYILEGCGIVTNEAIFRRGWISGNSND